ncbi:MAG: hypothetical protein WBA77_22480 [Microcoleaceae cyanobacterium]
MAETSPNSTVSAEQPVSAEELAALIAEFEQYRERLIGETTTTAQRAKQSQKKAMAQIEPELAKIEAALQHLRQRQQTQQPS